jgi:hypothetical protein
MKNNLVIQQHRARSLQNPEKECICFFCTRCGRFRVNLDTVLRHIAKEHKGVQTVEIRLKPPLEPLDI